MAKILKPKIQASGLLDAFELGVFKSVSERALTPAIGNSTLQSGGIKLVGGGIINSMSRNKHINLLSSAIIVDGIEDVVHSLLGATLGGAEGATASDW